MKKDEDKEMVQDRMDGNGLDGGGRELTLPAQQPDNERQQDWGAEDYDCENARLMVWVITAIGAALVIVGTAILVWGCE